MDANSQVGFARILTHPAAWCLALFRQLTNKVVKVRKYLRIRWAQLERLTNRDNNVYVEQDVSAQALGIGRGYQSSYQLEPQHAISAVGLLCLYALVIGTGDF